MNEKLRIAWNKGEVQSKRNKERQTEKDRTTHTLNQAKRRTKKTSRMRETDIAPGLSI